ncbi:hypothetical protein F4777DRAFT_575848 [Nemania sp. FL0916]|nr:hypothetical protein F4777DRAFT_575848 [Nemania sp. FL0916]
MCQEIQQSTFSCSHQMKFWWGEARFCLFSGKPDERFHVTYTRFDHQSEKCPKCKIGDKVRAEGKTTRGMAFRQAVEERYHQTLDYRQEQQGNHFQALADQAWGGLAARGISITDLRAQVKDNIALVLKGDKVTPGDKIVLLRTVTRLPQWLGNMKELIRFFGENYFHDKKHFEPSEKRKVYSILQKERLERTFNEGLNGN